MNKTAIVFPGQGSQSTAMLKDLAHNFPIVEATFNEASAILGYDLWDKVQNSDADSLALTTVTQPAMLAADVATFRMLQQEKNLDIDYLAGHSLGEYAALVASGVCDFSSTVKIVAKRATLMQEAVPVGIGAMAAILGLDDDAVIDLCKTVSKADNQVEAANFNSQGQVVIAGHKTAVDAAVSLAKEQGAKRAIILAMSVPSHCFLMKQASDSFAEFLTDFDFKSPAIKIIHNVDLSSPSDPQEIKNLLAKQLYSPVLWSKTIHSMHQENVTRIIEAGPGKILTNLIKRIVKEIEVIPILVKNDLDLI